MGGFIGGGGGGGGGGEQQIFPLEMDTSMGPGMLNLAAESSYNVGDILVITSSDLPGGGFIFPVFPDTIEGEMNYSLGAGETLALQTTGTGDFFILGTSPKLFAAEFATGGDTYTLPDYTYLPAGYTQLVVFNSGSGGVTVEPASGQTLTGGDQTISTLYSGMVFVNTGYDAWEPYSQTSTLPTPAATTLSSLAIAAGATHCWLGRDDPHADLVGSADLSDPSGQRQIPPIPAAVEGVLISNPNDSGRVGVSTATGAVTIHRNADRTFTWLFNPAEAEVWGDCNILGLGAYADADGLLALRSTGGGGFFASTPTFTGPVVTFGTVAAIKGKTCLITGRWVAATQAWTFWISIEGAAEIELSGSDATSRTSGTAEVWLGYANNSYADQAFHMHLALYDGDASAVRLEMYTALGWTDAA